VEFFPYHPRRFRLWLLAGLVASVALTAWAVSGVTVTDAPGEVLRAGLSMGLAGGFGLWLWRLRPRENWGVRLTPDAALISRPRAGLIEVRWRDVREVRRLGEHRDTLALWLDDTHRVLVPAHLFARREDFEALVRSVEDRLPAPRYDA
jgi:hypothetical protein